MNVATSSAHLLHTGIWQLELSLPEGAEERLLAYLSLLGKWNRVHNLTAVRDEQQMVSHHLLDSLTVLPYVAGYSSLADVGSGGGLPGIPLAIARPDMSVTLIEANRKKATFLQQAKIELGLGNVSVHCGRVEGYTPSLLYDAVISRAFSELALFIQVAGHLCAPEAPLLAMKGIDPQGEIAQLPSAWRVAHTQSLQIPGLDVQRHLITLIRK